MRHLASPPPSITRKTTREVLVHATHGLTAVDLFVLTDRLRSERCPAEGSKVRLGPSSISVSWEVETP